MRGTSRVIRGSANRLRPRSPSGPLRRAPDRSRRYPPRGAAAGRPSRTWRTRPRRSGDSGCGPRHRRCTAPASSGWRTPARRRSRCRSRSGIRRRIPCPRDDVVDVPLEPELRGVRADQRHAEVGVLLVPRAPVGQGAQPVDAGVGPEVDEDDAPAETRRGQWLRVEPAGRPVERRQVTLDGQDG